jgi:ribokinase
MTIWCLGSINADHIYSVPHLVAPGETLSATDYAMGLGGKGANQSVAAARAGAQVHHIGAVGPDGAWAVRALGAFGVEVSRIVTVEAPTAHAIIQVDATGENAILLFAGANMHVPKPDFAQAQAGDLLLLQNETNGTVEAARAAQARGLMVIYSAAPFDADAVRKILPYIDLLLVNSVENASLETELDEITVERVVTRGASGAEWIGVAHFPAHPVKAVDTTGAGDCFAGTLAAGLDAGVSREDALRRAIIASALQVTKKGTAEAMPSKQDVDRAMGL